MQEIERLGKRYAIALFRVNVVISKPVRIIWLRIFALIAQIANVRRSCYAQATLNHKQLSGTAALGNELPTGQLSYTII